MVFDIEIKKLFKKRLTITTQNGALAILNREEGYLSGALMNLALANGCSVIVYGKSPDYYQYILENEPQFIYTIDSTQLLKLYKLPFIEGTKDNTLLKVKDCFCDYDYERKYDYLAKREGLSLKDPNYYRTFMQIKAGKLDKEKVITEGLLTNIAAPSIYNDTLHEIVVFVDAPFKPVTQTLLDVLTEVSKGQTVSIILMYKGMDYLTEDYAMYSEGENIFVKARNRTFEVKDGEIFKQIQKGAESAK